MDDVAFADLAYREQDCNEYPTLVSYLQKRRIRRGTVSKLCNILRENGFDDDSWKLADEEDLLKLKGFGQRSWMLILDAQQQGQYRLFKYYLDQYGYFEDAIRMYVVDRIDTSGLWKSTPAQAYIGRRICSVAKHDGQVYYNQDDHSLSVWYDTTRVSGMSDRINAFLRKTAVAQFVEYILSHFSRELLMCKEFFNIVARLRSNWSDENSKIVEK